MRRGMKTAACCCAAAVLLAACSSDGTDEGGAATATAPVTAADAGDGRMPVVVDTDLAADDIVALAYLAADPRIDLRAVTVTGAGEVRCPRGADIALGLLAGWGEEDVPVACGRDTPIEGTREFPAEWRDAADDAYGLALRVVHLEDDAPDAVTLLADVLGSAPEPVTLLTLGPLTNVAEALAADPTVLDAVDRVVVMGGAVDVPGNVELEEGAEPLAAEWNLYVDPAAAARVIESGAPVTLVPLDATNAVEVTDEFVQQVVANDRTTASGYVADLLTERPPPFLWDPLAAIAATDPDLVPTRTASVTVVLDGDDAGRTAPDPAGTPVEVALAPDAATVLDHLVRVLAELAPDEALAVPTTLPTVGRATVSFDGATCTYDGPTSSEPGLLVIEADAGPVPYAIVVAHLTEGATAEETMAYVMEHPDEQPPTVDEATFIGEPGASTLGPAPLAPGTNIVLCFTEENGVYLAGAVEVDG